MRPEPQYSEGEHVEEVETLLGRLLVGGGGRWTLSENGKGVERTFKFKTFKATWEFMNVVAKECAIRRHHPEWSNIYNKTHVRWTTHNPSGLSRKDVDMATFCDEHGRDLGEIETPPDATVLDAAAQVGSADKPDQPNLGDMSRSLATEGGGCCKP